MAYKIHTLDLDFLGHRDTIAAYLVESEGNLVLIESGPHSTFDALKTAIQKVGFEIEQVKHVLLTHIHFDHAGAAWCLAPHATIYVHPFGEKHLIDPTKLYNSAKMIYKDDMDRLWGDMQGIPIEKLHATAHGETVEVGNLTFIAWHTPGHAVHHIAWQLEKDLFVGDVGGVKIDGGIVVPPCPPPDIDIETWCASLNLIRKLNVKTLHLTHFGQVSSVKKHTDSLEKRLIRWANWIKPHYEKGESLQQVTPQYQAFVKKELARFGITGEQYEQYESANPAWMSVAGLMRYWHKKQSKLIH
jgi:glyoxylase-like metal-dependent hydrolase (beta-lactamase superfamily II)